MSRIVALYCRISKDRNGKTEGVKAQEKWGREYAATAWPGQAVEVFKDNNISAANGDHRPEFERFREWVAAGRVAHVWAVEQSRLERREVGWFVLAAELDAAGITELHTNRDGIVRVRDEVAGIKAVLNAGEVRKLKKRVTDRLAEVAASGRPPGGTVFGYRHTKDAEDNKTLEIIPEQADAIRWAADQVLAGWSLTNIAAELRARGLTGSHGGRIGVSAVRSMTTNPAVSGLRVYRGRVVGPGVWEPILDEQIRRAVKAKLDVDRVVRRKDGGTYAVGAQHRGHAKGRKYELTGLAHCGVCGAPLVGTLKQRKKTKTGKVTSTPYLLCTPGRQWTDENGVRRNGRGCIGIALEPTSRFVVDQLFAELDKPEFLEKVAADNHADRRQRIAAALEAVERKREELAHFWNLPAGHPDALTTAEWQTARRAQNEREEELKAELRAVPPPVVNVDIAKVRATWPPTPEDRGRDGRMTLDECREFLRLFIDTVAVHRAAPGTREFDGGRVEIRMHP
ncbi:recombinase family protein [Kribbella sp. CA-245084]|uniref:recombinase family protein n=1 Tax=Kribbella sp. CA-245084 TaxID=3239940 RepID=UPI003D8C5066